MSPDSSELLKRASGLTPEKFEWGQITWLVTGESDPGAGQTVGLCVIKPGASNPLHYHPNFEEVLYVISGSCAKRVGSASFDMAAGDVARIPVGKEHQATAGPDEPLVCLITYDTPDRQVVFV